MPPAMTDVSVSPRDFSAPSTADPSAADPAARPARVQGHYVGAVFALAAAAALEVILPLGIDTAGSPSGFLVGLVCVLAAAATIAWASAAIQARLKVMDPARPVTALVTEGPYARSRNPVQLALALGIVGISALASLDWGVFAAVCYLVWLRIAVIPKEEARKQARFGQAWTEYRARVRRWL